LIRILSGLLFVSFAKLSACGGIGLNIINILIYFCESIIFIIR